MLTIFFSFQEWSYVFGKHHPLSIWPTWGKTSCVLILGWLIPWAVHSEAIPGWVGEASIAARSVVKCRKGLWTKHLSMYNQDIIMFLSTTLPSIEYIQDTFKIYSNHPSMVGMPLPPLSCTHCGGKKGLRFYKLWYTVFIFVFLFLHLLYSEKNILSLTFGSCHDEIYPHPFLLSNSSYNGEIIHVLIMFTPPPPPPMRSRNGGIPVLVVVTPSYAVLLLRWRYTCHNYDYVLTPFSHP